MQDELGKSVEGIELPRFTYQAPAWSRLRWVIEIRQYIERRALPKGKTLSLFADDPVVGKYRFSALTTDLNLSAEIIWHIYRGRADCESRIKELKYDFATDSFNKTTAESLKIVRRKIYGSAQENMMRLRRLRTRLPWIVHRIGDPCLKQGISHRQHHRPDKNTDQPKTKQAPDNAGKDQ